MVLCIYIGLLFEIGYHHVLLLKSIDSVSIDQYCLNLFLLVFLSCCCHLRLDLLGSIRLWRLEQLLSLLLFSGGSGYILDVDYLIVLGRVWLLMMVMSV